MSLRVSGYIFLFIVRTIFCSDCSSGLFSVFSTAGRFSLMRKANWGRQSYQMPWRRSQRNTTVSYRQIPQRTKYDGPGEPQPNPKHFFLFFALFCCSMEWETLREFWFPVPLTTHSKQHLDRLQRTQLCFVSAFFLSFSVYDCTHRVDLRFRRDSFYFFNRSFI